MAVRHCAVGAGKKYRRTRSLIASAPIDGPMQLSGKFQFGFASFKA